MSVDTFEASLQHAKPPEDWSHALQALWWDARGDWDKAHSLFRSTKQIVNALGSMPICIGKKVIFRMQLIGTNDPVTL